MGYGFSFHEWATRIALTFNDIKAVLPLVRRFPLLILVWWRQGIADLEEHAGWLLAVTAALAAAFTGIPDQTYLVGRAVFPALSPGSQAGLPDDAGAAFTALFGSGPPAAVRRHVDAGAGLRARTGARLPAREGFQGDGREFEVIERGDRQRSCSLLPVSILPAFPLDDPVRAVMGVLGVFVKLIYGDLLHLDRSVLAAQVQFSVCSDCRGRSRNHCGCSARCWRQSALGTRSSAATIPT